MDRPSLGADDTVMRSASPSFRQSDVAGHLSPTLQQMYPSPDLQAPTGRRSISSKREPVQPIIHRDAAITRTDLIASAEVIFAKYLLQGADKEIYLPPPLRLHDFPLSAERLPNMSAAQYDTESDAMAGIPDMFTRQKVGIFPAPFRPVSDSQGPGICV